MNGVEEDTGIKRGRRMKAETAWFILKTSFRVKSCGNMFFQFRVEKLFRILSFPTSLKVCCARWTSTVLLIPELVIRAESFCQLVSFITTWSNIRVTMVLVSVKKRTSLRQSFQTSKDFNRMRKIARNLIAILIFRQTRLYLIRR